MYDQGKLYAYVLVQQSGSANSIVATCSRVYVVDHPELCTCIVATYTYDAKSLCALPVPVPQLLSVVQLRFCVLTQSGVESLYEERPLQ